MAAVSMSTVSGAKRALIAARPSAVRTAAPVTVRLLHALRAHGMDVPLDALTVSDCADAVAAALKP